MENSYSGKLQLWEGWTRTVVRDLPLLASGLPHLGRIPGELARRLFLEESLEPRANPGVPEGAEPYSLQWFLDIENRRHGGRGRWIPRLLEFSRHSGETVLGLGRGLGTDWLQYARHGAGVIVCSPSGEQLTFVRRNFELRGLSGRFLHARGDSLPVESASIDVVCVSSLLRDEDDVPGIVEEIYRVLKPGGKVLAVARARYDLDCWLRFACPWRHWLSRDPTKSAASRAGFSARELRHGFARFTEPHVHKRVLRRAELPHLWRWLPMPLMERLLGHVLIIKAFKPLTAAISLRIAA